jgi:hypothetical protein
MRRTLMVMVVSALCAVTADAYAAQRKTGTIVSLDNASKTFICQWGGEDKAYKTTDTTVFRAGAKAASWSDLKLGERVNILYRVVDKDRVADRVTIEKR